MDVNNPWAIYELIDQQAGGLANARIHFVCLGINWTVATVETGEGLFSGLCFSPADATRTMVWPGTLAGKPVVEIIPWIKSWNPCEAAIGVAVANALVNSQSPLLQQSQPLTSDGPAHLRVFEHFFARERRGNVVIIGHYPGIERYADKQQITCLERRPQSGDLPDTAAEYLLPQADWVFVSASSIANKTLPRLLQLSQNANVVLMGPSLPWLAEWRQFKVDYLAGVAVTNQQALMQVAMEGGGTRIFDAGVRYQLLAL